MKQCLFIILLVSLTGFSQDLKQVKKDMNEWFKYPTADSLKYYYVAASADEIYSIDENENFNLVTTIPSTISFLHKNLIINKNKMIYADEVGSNAGAIIKDYYLFNGSTHEYLYTSEAELKNDHIIKGDVVYYHDTKKVYKTSLTNVSDLTVLYESTTATNTNGIRHVFLSSNFLIVFDYDMNTGITGVKKIDLGTNQVTVLDEVVQSRAYFYNGEVYYSENEWSSFDLSKIYKINLSGSIETIFTETSTNQLQQFKNVNQNGVFVILDNNNKSYLANVKNGTINSLNAGPISNPYPHFVGETYSAGELLYFVADDTTYNQSISNSAIWVTDGTATGTKKIVSNSSSLKPTFFSNLDEGIGNCFENIWIGYNSDKTVHLNAYTENYEKYDTLKYAIGFYPIANHSYTYFIAYDAFGRYSINKISCGSGLGLDEKHLAQTEIFPNPTNDVISLYKLRAGLKTIQVIDFNGKVLMQESCLTSSYKLDISGMKSGLYLVKIAQDSSAEVFKIIKP